MTHHIGTSLLAYEQLSGSQPLHIEGTEAAIANAGDDSHAVYRRLQWLARSACPNDGADQIGTMDASREGLEASHCFWPN